MLDAFEFRVDGALAAFDFSDFIHFDRTSWGHEHWYKRAHCAGHRPIKHLVSFPPTSFLNWNRCRELMATKRYTASGSMILHKQSTPKPTCRVGEDLYQRRMKAREILIAAFVPRVDTELEPQLKFFTKAFECLVSVHIPGSWPHLLDRGQQQMFALGICTISPDIWTYCLDMPPQRWLHYVPILDDFSDLPEKVEWCQENRDRCRQIGRHAQEFFVRRSTPQAIWIHVIERVRR